MASQGQSDRSKLTSVIRNSTSRRSNRPEANPNIPAFGYSIQSADDSHHSRSETTSAFGSISNTGMVQKLAGLSQLEIPCVPQSAELLRHPTVLRAGPPMSTTPSRGVIENDWQELFIRPVCSILPRTIALPNIMRDMPYLTPDQAVSPFILPASTASDKEKHPQEVKSVTNKANSNAELKTLRHAINTLYDSSCLLIPPYLLDRLNHLEVIDNEFDFTFQEYKSEHFTVTEEKLDRVQQFLPVLKQVIDLVSGILVKERNTDVREP